MSRRPKPGLDLGVAYILAAAGTGAAVMFSLVGFGVRR